jgi:diguanylate cyclase (GGDEF)-like protein
MRPDSAPGRGVVLLALVAVISCGTALAERGRYAFRTYSDEDGLANLTVECLLQDATGFLWIGTQEGLFRFDGRRFVRFGREQGLPSTKINVLHETASGRLYAGTRSGLAVLDGLRFVPLGAQVGLPESTIPDSGVVSDSSGTVYVATTKGLFVSDGQRFRMEPDPAGGEASITALHVDGAGALYFARGRTLYRRVAGKSVDFGSERGLEEIEQIDSTVTDGAGRLWVRTLTTLQVLERGANRFRRHDDGLPAGINSGRLALDGSKELLVPTVGGLARNESEKWTLLGRAEGLESNSTVSALVDREGFLWLGMAGYGLVQRLGLGNFLNWGVPEGFSNEVVWSIARERTRRGPGALWVGTQHGLNRIAPDDQSVRVLHEQDGLAGNTVYALVASDDGSVWAGSWPGGVTRFGPEPGRIQKYGAWGLRSSDYRVSSLHISSSGEIWAGARTGVYRLAHDPSALEFVRFGPLPGGDPLDSVYSFAEDSSGALWCAGRSGLQRLTGPYPRRFGKRDGLREDFLSSVAALPDGSLMVGYREALGADRVVAHGDHIEVRPLRLSSAKVLFLGRDARGCLWVGTDAGIDVVQGEERIAHFGKADGLASNDMDQNAFFAEADGTVWFGTSRGLVRHRPTATTRRPLPPRIVLTECRGGDRVLDLEAAARLSGRERQFTVEWAGLAFSDPKSIRYRYRLVGLEDSWSETSAVEKTYGNIGRGQYRFEVFAVSATGVSSTAPAAFRFEVLPPWWETPWAVSGALLALAGGFFGVVRLRTRALEADRRRLEAAVADRSRELAAANRELQEASFTDPLTGLRNRRYFDIAVVEDCSRAIRAYREAGSDGAPQRRDVLFFAIDFDHFKDVNDRYGHEAGDRVLENAAARLSGVARKSDMLIRWGGEEFLLVARDEMRANADALARRILEAISFEPFRVSQGHEVRVTCSIGWAPFPLDPREPEKVPYQEVLRLADRALYRAKETGRNRVVGFTSVRGEAIVTEGV